MIDIEKFICSLLADHPEGVAVRGDIHRALKEQGLEYKDGKIVPIEDKESEDERDERIRKAIIKETKGSEVRLFETVTNDEFIAWLEKQSNNKPIERKEFTSIPFGAFDSELIEQMFTIPDGYVATIEGNKIHIKREYKTATEAVKEEKVDNANKVESKFKVGDWVVSPMGVYWHIDAIRDGRYQVTSDSGVSVDWPLNTKLYHRFTIQDAEDGDVLVSGEVVFIFKTIHGVWLNCYCSVHKDGSLNMDSYDLLTNKYFGEVYPSTKEQRDLLYQKMKEAGYEWDNEEKGLKKI